MKWKSRNKLKTIHSKSCNECHLAKNVAIAAFDISDKYTDDFLNLTSDLYKNKGMITLNSLARFNFVRIRIFCLLSCDEYERISFN